MKNKKIKSQIGKWSAFVGFFAAAIMGFAETTGGNTALLLVILGGIMGLMNIQKKEIQGFLLATIALMLLGSAGLDKLPAIGKYMSPIITNIVTFAAPAAMIVALKEVYTSAKA